MNDKEILVDLLQDFGASFRTSVEGVPSDALCWQPDAEANSIGLTVWHVSRMLDVLQARVLTAQPPQAEQWHARGWAVKTGYDPSGLGASGLGILTGYTPAEVRAVPILCGEDLLTYFNQTHDALSSYLREMPSAALYQPPVGWPGGPETAYAAIRLLTMDSREHLGEVKALKAMWARSNQTARSD